MQTIGLYRDAEVYDILHAPGTVSEVVGLERLWRRWGNRVGLRRGDPGVWMEPACGTARYLRMAARRGREVLGIDKSRSMIAYARRAMRADGVGAPADLRVGDMNRLPAGWRGRVDLAFCLINSIRHLESDAAVLSHLRAVAGVLCPGGIYAVGLTLTAYGLEYPSEDIWSGRRGRTHVKQIIQFVPPITPADKRARAEQAYSHLIITRGTSVEHRDSAYTLRTYSRVQWEGLIARSPFRVKATVDEDGAPLALSPSGYAIWVLEARTGGRAPKAPR